MIENLISIIVPTYNNANDIERCIDSLRGQTLSNLEIIIINDGSSDGTKDILSKFEMESNIVVINKENEGVSKTRNLGLRIAKGEFIAFVDGDDTIEKDMYEKLLTSMQVECSDIAFCQCKIVMDENFILQKEKNLLCLVANPKNIEFFFSNELDAMKDNIITKERIQGSACRCLFKKEIIERKKIMFYEEVFIEEDLIFLLEYLQYVKKISFVDEYLYDYYRNTASATARKYKPNLLKNHKRMYELKSNLLESNEKIDAQKRKLICSRIKYQMVFSLIANEMLNVDHANLKILSKDKFFKKITKFNVLGQIIFDKKGFLRITYFVLIKLRRWGLIRLLYNKVK